MLREYWFSVLVFLALVNLCAFLLILYDKYAARHNFRRISEKFLWLTALCFGAPGILLGMLLQRHKTRHIAFMFGMPLLLVAQIALFVSLMML